MLKKSVFFAAALAFGAFSGTAVFATGETVPAYEPAGGNATATATAVNFSFAPFYAISENSYGVSGSSIDLHGLTFLLNYEVRKPDVPYATEIGIFTVFGLGDDDFSISGYDCSADQYDFMLGVRFGIRIPCTEKISVGIGLLGGLDLRRGELESDLGDFEETELGAVGGAYLEGVLKSRDNWSLVVNYSWLVTNVNFDGELDGVGGKMTYHMFSVGCRFTW